MGLLGETHHFRSCPQFEDLNSDSENEPIEIMKVEAKLPHAEPDAAVACCARRVLVEKSPWVYGGVEKFFFKVKIRVIWVSSEFIGVFDEHHI